MICSDSDPVAVLSYPLDPGIWIRIRDKFFRIPDIGFGLFFAEIFLQYLQNLYYVIFMKLVGFENLKLKPKAA
jgi:ABC-type multidrug transport system permease subunit